VAHQQTPETRDKIAVARRGKKHSAATKAKISESMLRRSLKVKVYEIRRP
jgi:hypothetical protein